MTLGKCIALVRLALSALGPGSVPVLPKQEADEAQPEGFDTRGKLPVHKRSVGMAAPGALVQVRSVPRDQYEGPLSLARRRSPDPGAEP